MTESMERFRRVFLGKFGRFGICFTRFEQNSGISSPYHFRHAGEIILAGDGANPITTITILVRHAVTETDHRCDDMGGADIGDVEAFHHPRNLRQLQSVGQGAEVGLRLDRCREGAAGEAARRTRSASQVIKHVAQFGRLFEIELFRLCAHLFFQLRHHFAGMSFEKFAGLCDTFAINLRRDFT